MDEIKEKIARLGAPIAEEQGVRIEDIELAGNLRRMTVRIFIDKEGGVSLEDCERFSRSLSVLLDVEDFIQSRYVLEVSSPGLDRPLRTAADFERAKGKLARIVTKSDVINQTFFIGRIAGVDEGTVILSVEKKGEVAIPIELVSKARLEIEFK